MRLASLLALTAAAAAAPAVARAQSIADAADPETAYEQQAVGVRHLVLPLRDGNTNDAAERLLYDGKWDAFAGRDHHPIDEEAFFRIVGRDDLAQRYHRTAIIKQTLTSGGWLLVVGGAIAATLAVMPGGQPAVEDPGNGSSTRPFSPVWGLAAMGTGIVSIIVGHFLDPTPVGADEADALARDHDQSLRDRPWISQTASRD